MPADVASPKRILDIGFAFRSAKVLLSAVELGVFSALKSEPLGAEVLVSRLGLHGRGARDFFDALVSLGLLERYADGRYGNVSDCSLYLDPDQPAYVGGILEYLNARVYESWGRLTPALRNGTPQAGPSAAGGYAAFYEDPSKLDTFLRGMTAGSIIPAQALAAAFPWQSYRTFIDIGTAQGCMPVELARAHPHLTGGGFDLPALRTAFTSYVGRHGLSERLKFYAGDFFRDALPTADVLVMGRVLHNWDLETRMLLLRRAYSAISPGGALIVCETLIDDARRAQSHSLLASLNMLIQTSGGSEFTGAECAAWMQEVGFSRIRIDLLGALYSAVIGRKQT